ncbi:MAG: hypothetical protein J7J77_02105 [Candidatus Cloacimonetes bacterium]|nr:hypothetical protein [Candidatus Cloacimonadota bacterium]
MKKAKVVGYLEGTDSWFLTNLVAKGYETLPLGNGADNHGKYIGLISKTDNISLVIGYLHKVVPLSGMNITTKDILYSCKMHKIPVMIIVPEKLHENAKEILGDMANYVMLVDPAKLLEKILEFLK